VPEGKAIITFARQVLGKSETGVISVEEATIAAQTLAAKPFNGDGIVPPESASDEASQAVIGEIMGCLGEETDASGMPGVSQAKIDRFFNEAAAYCAWWKQAQGNETILPLGLATPSAAAAVKALKPKVDDFFARCRLAVFDPRSLTALN